MINTDKPNVKICNNCKKPLNGKIKIIYTDGKLYVAYCKICMKSMDMNEFYKSIEALRGSYDRVEHGDIFVGVGALDEKSSFHIMLDDYKHYVKDASNKSFAGIIGQTLFNRDDSYNRSVVRVDRIEDKMFYGTKLHFFTKNGESQSINYSTHVYLFNIDDVIRWNPITEDEIENMLSELFGPLIPFKFFKKSD